MELYFAWWVHGRIAFQLKSVPVCEHRQSTSWLCTCPTRRQGWQGLEFVSGKDEWWRVIWDNCCVPLLADKSWRRFSLSQTLYRNDTPRRTSVYRPNVQPIVSGYSGVCSVLVQKSTEGCSAVTRCVLCQLNLLRLCPQYVRKSNIMLCMYVFT